MIIIGGTSMMLREQMIHDMQENMRDAETMREQNAIDYINHRPNYRQQNQSDSYHYEQPQESRQERFERR